MDKSRVPYILHPLTVMNDPELKSYEEKIVAVCHDLFEDTKVTPQRMLELGFPQRIVDCILALSKPDDMVYEEYILTIKNHPDPIVKKVKKADLRHNSDLSRLSNITEKDIERREKYQNAIKVLDGIKFTKQEVLEIKQFIDNNKKFDDIIYRMTLHENNITNSKWIDIDYNYNAEIEDEFYNDDCKIPNRYNRHYRMSLTCEYFKRFSNIDIRITWEPITE